MKKTFLLVLIVAVSFVSGFAFNGMLNPAKHEGHELKRATGIGGIFFKCKDPKKVREWYQKHLGLNTNQYGAVFEWRQGADTTQKGFTQWSPFKETTQYFGRSGQMYMINYRVHDLTALAEALRKEGVTIVDSIETADYGKFLHIEDVEGNRVELWEPNDVEYEKLGKEMGSETTK